MLKKYETGLDFSKYDYISGFVSNDINYVNVDGNYSANQKMTYAINLNVAIDNEKLINKLTENNQVFHLDKEKIEQLLIESECLVKDKSTNNFVGYKPKFSAILKINGKSKASIKYDSDYIKYDSDQPDSPNGIIDKLTMHIYKHHFSLKNINDVNQLIEDIQSQLKADLQSDIDSHNEQVIALFKKMNQYVHDCSQTHLREKIQNILQEHGGTIPKLAIITNFNSSISDDQSLDMRNHYLSKYVKQEFTKHYKLCSDQDVIEKLEEKQFDFKLANQTVSGNLNSLDNLDSIQRLPFELAAEDLNSDKPITVNFETCELKCTEQDVRSYILQELETFLNEDPFKFYNFYFKNTRLKMKVIEELYDGDLTTITDEEQADKMLHGLLYSETNRGIANNIILNHIEPDLINNFFALVMHLSGKRYRLWKGYGIVAFA